MTILSKIICDDVFYLLLFLVSWKFLKSINTQLSHKLNQQKWYFKQISQPLQGYCSPQEILCVLKLNISGLENNIKISFDKIVYFHKIQVST